VNEYRIASIPGDGIGPEVVNEGIKVLGAIEEIHGSKLFNIDSFDWNCTNYLKTGRMMPENGIEILKPYDSILWGSRGKGSSRSCLGLGIDLADPPGIPTIY
jgi:tartrate dehydrogenase/decarboxylase/D-malate dehydrogenase